MKIRACLAYHAIVSSVVIASMSGASAQETAYDKAYDPETKTIRLNPDDPSGDLIFQKRDFSQDNRPPGPINVQRTVAGLAYIGIPTFYRLPVALTPEDLRAGTVEVALMSIRLPISSWSTMGISRST